jgi:hypothetical protein
VAGLCSRLIDPAGTQVASRYYQLAVLTDPQGLRGTADAVALEGLPAVSRPH